MRSPGVDDHHADRGQLRAADAEHAQERNAGGHALHAARGGVDAEDGGGGGGQRYAARHINGDGRSRAAGERGKDGVRRPLVLLPRAVGRVEPVGHAVQAAVGQADGDARTVEALHAADTVAAHVTLSAARPRASAAAGTGAGAGSAAMYGSPVPSAAERARTCRAPLDGHAVEWRRVDELALAEPREDADQAVGRHPHRADAARAADAVEHGHDGGRGPRLAVFVARVDERDGEGGLRGRGNGESRARRHASLREAEELRHAAAALARRAGRRRHDEGERRSGRGPPWPSRAGRR